MDKFPPSGLPEEPRAEQPRIEEPRAEEPRAEQPCVEEPRAEQPRVEEPRDIDCEWAETLHLDYDAEEAARRAARAQTPPPMPGQHVGMPPKAPGSGLTYGAPDRPYSAPDQAYGAPGRPYGNGARPPMPPTYLAWSVIATIFCCLIPGIIGIIYSSMVSSRYYTGDIEGARRASDNAQICIIISIVLGVISTTVSVPLSLFL